MSDEEFFIIREKDIVSLESMSKETIFMYEAYVNGEEMPEKIQIRCLVFNEWEI